MGFIMSLLGFFILFNGPLRAKGSFRAATAAVSGGGRFPGRMMYLYPPTSILNPTTLPLPRPPPLMRVSCNYGGSSSTPRDRVVDFGKYKGRMLGTLPSSYLRWLSNNLRAGDFEHWASLAHQVLRDPVYNDRIEWEFAEAVLTGNNGGRVGSEDGGSVAQLLEIGERFGWDNDYKAGWSRVDFELLGTSRGGRIPRVGDRGRAEARRANGGGRPGEVAGIEERRKGRRVRAMMRMKKETGGGAVVGMTGRRDGGGKIGDGKERRVEEAEKVYNPFPGREALLRKFLNRRR